LDPTNPTTINTAINIQATVQHNQITFLHKNNINRNTQTKTTPPMATDVAAGAGKPPFFLIFEV
jgi:hypothetical protein